MRQHRTPTRFWFIAAARDVPTLPKLIRSFLLATVGVALPVFGDARAAGRFVELELVLAVDTSASVSEAEYHLQMQGIANALRDPEVAAAIASYGETGVALTMVHWSAEPSQVIAWELVTDAAGAARVAGKIERLPRSALGVTTAIGSALALSRQLIVANAYAGRRRSIDVSGDGKSNDGLPLWHERNRTVTDEITINGLAIVNDDSGLDEYYRDYVIGGPEAFMIAAEDFSDFQRAFREKLLRELRAVVAENRRGYRAARVATGRDELRCCGSEQTGAVIGWYGQYPAEPPRGSDDRVWRRGRN